MVERSLEDKLAQFASPVEMLRNHPASRFSHPYRDQYTNWQSEQAAWARTATLFDQSHHMTDVYFTGPDAYRLMSDTGTNSFATFGPDKAKHFIACNTSGHLIGTAVLFGHNAEEVSLVGPAAAANWVQFHAETGNYDVEVRRDERTVDNGGQRELFRYEIEGPAAWSIVEKANGGPIEKVGFFRITSFQLNGIPVKGLVHTMAGLPGAESMGLEIWGPVEHGPRCLDALLSAGAEFDMVRGGGLAYYAGGIESGYMAQPTAAVYSGADLQAYREWLPHDGYEGVLTIGGSYASESIEDYYSNPYDFGYGHLVRFDHDFIGRDALQELQHGRHRRKVWLVWNNEDVARIYASSLFDGDRRAKYLDTPIARYARVQADAVYAGADLVGISTMCGYSVNIGRWSSVAMVDEPVAVDGVELSLLWGEENGGTKKLAVERHTQYPIRATVSTNPPLIG